MKKIFLFLSLLIANTAFAANKTVYVRTACANNGTGSSASCAGSPGGAGAYNTCANAITGEVAANADLVSMAGILTIDLAGATAEVTSCNISGFTTDATHYVKLVGDYVGGNYDTSKYHFESSIANGSIQVNDDYVEIYNIQSNNNGTGSGSYYGVNAANGGGSLSVKVFNSLFIGSTGTGNTGCIYFRPDVANAVGVFVNNMCYGYSGANAVCYTLNGSGYNNGETIIAYNNGCHGAPKGYTTHGGGTGDAQYLKNNWAQSNSTAGFSLDEGGAHTTSTTATNLSEDTSSPNNTLDSKVITFVNEGSNDLHLSGSDTSAKDAGTDLSADAQYPFSTDYEGTTRTGSWDVGPDEAAAGGGSGAALFELLLE